MTKAITNPKIRWCQDTSDPGHFGPKTFRHHLTGAEVSGQFGTSAEVSFGHFGTSAEVSFGHFGTSAELSRPRSHISRIC